MKKLLLIAISILGLSTQGSAQCATSSAPTNNCTPGDFIDTFVLNGLAASGIAGCSANGYGSFGIPTWSLQVGGTYTWSATTGNNIYQQGLAIWIDLNNDGFYANSEQLASTSPALSHTGTITIPFTAVVANGIKMRVRCAYYITISNSDACTSNIGSFGETQDFLVNITCPASAPTLSVAATSTYVCSGTSVTLTASGASTFSWTGGISNGVGFIPTSTQQYTVTGGVSGCPTATATTVRTISVTSTPLTIGAVISPTVVCAGKTATITAAGASNYTYSPPNQASANNTFIVSPVAPTTYTITGYNGSGCPGSSTISLAVNPIPTISAVTSATSVCPGGSATLTASGASTYSWSTGGTGASIVITPAVSLAYIVTGTNNFNCSSNTTTIVLVSTPPVVMAVANKTLVCPGGSATLTASGAVNYDWAQGPSTNSYVVTPSASQVYTVTGYSQEGCTDTKTVAVNIFNPVLTVSSSTAICIGNSALLSASGANTYSWAGVGNTSQVSVSPTLTTTYSLSTSSTSNQVTCFNSGAVTVTVNPNPVVTIVPSRTEMCRNEAITFTASGASSYTWSPGTQNNAVITVTTGIAVPLNYSVNATDVNGCTAGSSIQVKVNTCNAIAELSGFEAFNIYPNPNDGAFTISSSAAISLSFMNELGQLVKKLDMEKGSTRTFHRGELPAGIYFIISDSGRGTQTSKLVLTR